MNALYGCPISFFCFCWDLEHTILDFLIEFELIIVFELTLCCILVLFSLHLHIYAWVLNLARLNHIFFFANLNHFLDSSAVDFLQHTLYFYTSVICMDMELILCVSRILNKVSFFVIFQKLFLSMFQGFLHALVPILFADSMILYFFTD